MTSSTATPKPRRRIAREPKHDLGTASPVMKPSSKLDQVEALLLRTNGASIAEMMETTGWQQHSVRGALAGALKKKRDLTITSEKHDGVRRYHASRPA